MNTLITKINMLAATFVGAGVLLVCVYLQLYTPIFGLLLIVVCGIKWLAQLETSQTFGDPEPYTPINIMLIGALLAALGVVL